MQLDIVKLGNKKLIFRNKEHVDERLIYEEVLKRMIKLSGAKHIENLLGASEDVSIWSVNGSEVQVVYDIDYGVEVSAKTEMACDELMHSLSEQFESG